MLQLTYDGFEAHPQDKSFGKPFWAPNRFFSELNITMSEGAAK